MGDQSHCFCKKEELLICVIAVIPMELIYDNLSFRYGHALSSPSCILTLLYTSNQNEWSFYKRHLCKCKYGFERIFARFHECRKLLITVCIIWDLQPMFDHTDIITGFDIVFVFHTFVQHQPNITC